MSIQEVLARFRSKLLDLSKRNRLVNYKYTAKTIRIIDESIHKIFTELNSDREMVLTALPEPKTADLIQPENPEERPKRPSEVEWAKKNNLSPSFDLGAISEDSNADRHNDPKLQTLLYPEDLDILSRKVLTQYKSSIDETGTNTLYLCLGMLKYYDSDDSNEPIFAPLVLLPTRLSKQSPGRGEAYPRHCLANSGEESSVNICLFEKLKSEFSVILPQPEVGEDGTYDIIKYFLQVDLVLQSSKPRWQLIRELNLCHLQYAKIRMFKDLQPAMWPNSSILSHKLVSTLVNGAERVDQSQYAADVDIDRLNPLIVPNLIFDADSSQHSALIDVLSGKNTVIEGPPGTGKSQTITNIIAAALERGKSVLFVSEKLAALEVVKNRLQKAGLGEFCCELHSTKANKKIVLREFKSRRIKEYSNPRDLIRARQELNDAKSKLNEYSQKLKEVMPILNMSFQDAFNRFLELDEKLGVVEKHKNLAIVPGLISKADDHIVAQEKLRNFLLSSRSLMTEYGSIDKNPWYRVVENTSLSDERIIDEATRLSELANATQDLIKGMPNLIGLLNYDLSRTIDFFKLAAEIDKKNVDAKAIPLIIGICGNREALDVLHFLEVIKKIEQLRAELSNTGHAYFSESESLKDFVSFARSLPENLSRVQIGNLEERLSIFAALNRNIQDVSSFIVGFVKVAGCTEHLPISSFKKILRSVSTVILMPDFDNRTIELAFKSYGDRAILSRLSVQSSHLKTKRNELRNTVGVELNEEAQVIRKKAGALKSHRWWHFINSQSRSLKSWAFQLYPGATNCSVIAEQLIKLADYKEGLNEFNQRALELRSSDWVKGIDTDFAEIQLCQGHISNLLEQLSSFCSEELKVAQALMMFEKHKLRSLVTPLGNSINEIVDAIEGNLAQLTTLGLVDTWSDSNVEMLGQLIKNRIPELNLILDNPFVKKSDRFSSLLMLEAKATCAIDLKHAESVRNSIAEQFKFLKSGDFDRGLLEQAISVANHISSSTEDIRSLVITEPVLVNVINGDLTEIYKKLEAISKNGYLKTSFNSLAGLSSTYKAAIEKCSALYLMRTYQSAKVAVEGGVFKNFAQLAEHFIADDILRLAESRFLHFYIESFISKDENLRSFTSLDQKLLRESFAKLDVEVIALQRREIAAKIAKADIPVGNSTGNKSTWTQLSLLENEMQKEARHIPVRKLIERAAAACLSLKPCFMMSPLSVSQFLPAGAIEFDLVVMDEASQLRPEDAIGAIARARQIVVVGDSKQLPPSNVFEVALSDDGQEVEDDESILEHCASVFKPSRRLRWHYRSKHQSLIAVSNQEFYDNDLIVFPSTLQKHKDLGMNFCRIDGEYEMAGRNMKEAQEVLRAILDHVERTPSKTLGVVAMNAKQKEIIEDLVLNEARKNEELAEYIDREGANWDKFFIKNLENVQGDERDVIFISMTYGRTSDGSFYQRFGPINSKNGHRRLNVLFTRAKITTKIFCSFEPEELQVTETSSLGVKVLRNFLFFAKTNILVSEGRKTATPEISYFEKSVAEEIAKMGFELIHQVGVAGYFIDIGIPHPVFKSNFVLGIECDGAQYHSSRSARDRDRLRQSNLENLGWQIFRIWSVDWFKNRPRELVRLKTHIESAISQFNVTNLQSEHFSKSTTDASIVASEKEELKADSVSDEELLKHAQNLLDERQNLAAEEMRSKLVRLREEKITKAFPSVSREFGILRSSILDLLIKHQPKDEKSFNLLLSQNRIYYDTRHRQFIGLVLDTISGRKINETA